MNAVVYPGQNTATIGLRIFDAMLLYSLIQDPRRDTYILAQFCKSVTEFVIQAIPRSCMPYDTILLERIDPITGNQLCLDLRQHVLESEEHDDPGIPRRSECIHRLPFQHGITDATRFECAGLGASGVLEDELFMSSIMELARNIGVARHHQIPISSCKVCFIPFPSLRKCVLSDPYACLRFPVFLFRWMWPGKQGCATR